MLSRCRRKQYNTELKDLAWNLEKRFIDEATGFGVFAKERISSGTFLLEYTGTILQKDPGYSDYVFEFKFHGQRLWIDPAPFSSLCCMVNDDHIKPNSKMKLMDVNGKPKLWLQAIRNIQKDEEIRYNYGPGDFPWRKKHRKKNDQEEIQDRKTFKHDQKEIQYRESLKEDQGEIQDRDSLFKVQVEIQDRENLVDQEETQDRENLQEDKEEIKHRENLEGVQGEKQDRENIEDQGGIQGKENLIEDQGEVHGRENLVEVQVEIQDREILVEDQGEIQGTENLEDQGETQDRENLQEDQKEIKHRENLDGVQEEKQDRENLEDQGEIQSRENLQEDQEETQDRENLQEDQGETQDREILAGQGEIQDIENLKEDQGEVHDRKNLEEDQGEIGERENLEDDLEIVRCTKRQASVLSESEDEHLAESGDSDYIPESVFDLEWDSDTSLILPLPRKCSKAGFQQEVQKDQGEIQDKENLKEDQREIQDRENLVEVQAELQDRENLEEDQREIQDRENLEEDHGKIQDREILEDQGERQDRKNLVEDQEELQDRENLEDDLEIIRCTKRQASVLSESEDEILAESGDSDYSDYIPESVFDLESDSDTSLILPLPRKRSKAGFQQKVQDGKVDSSDTLDLGNSKIQEEVRKSQTGSSTNCKRKTTQHNAKRPCMYCGVIQTNLNRHLKVAHKTEELVVSACDAPNKGARDAIFAQIRKTGIFNYNKKMVAKDLGEESLFRERSSTKDVAQPVFCSLCHGFYSSKYFFKHAKRCCALSDSAENMPKASKTELLVPTFGVSDAFKKSIMSRFKGDEIGTICCTDEVIMMFGSRMYEKMCQKQDKKAEVKRSVMSDMRRLAHLYSHFKQGCENATPELCTNAADMLLRSNFNILTNAVETYTRNENSATIKAGLKNALYFLILKLAKIYKGMCLVRRQDELAAEVDKFLDVLKLYQHVLFGDARYHLNRKREVRLRRPEELPSEDDVLKLKTYTVNRMSAILGDPFVVWDKHQYGELRNLATSRVTLFNARRGGEPARLTVSEWEDADRGVWLDPSRRPKLDEVEAKLFSDLKITFQGGKGNNHLVSIIFPKDCYETMRKLADPEVRRYAGIAKNNKYMFPCSGGSDMHVSGWHAVNKVCKKAGIAQPPLLTATKMRHRVSTLYAGLDVPESDHRLFYQHMGHEPDINRNIYQSPLAEAAIIKVGVHLREMDGHFVKNKNLTYSASETKQLSTSSTISAPEASDMECPALELQAPSTSASSITSFPEPCILGANVLSLSEESDDDYDEQFTLGRKTGKAQNQKSRKADYTKWSPEATDKVKTFFKEYLDPDGPKVVEKKQILAFQQQFPEISHDWKRIRSKLDNEKRALKARSIKRMKTMSRDA